MGSLLALRSVLTMVGMPKSGTLASLTSEIRLGGLV